MEVELQEKAAPLFVKAGWISEEDAKDLISVELPPRVYRAYRMFVDGEGHWKLEDLSKFSDGFDTRVNDGLSLKRISKTSGGKIYYSEELGGSERHEQWSPMFGTLQVWGYATEKIMESAAERGYFFREASPGEPGDYVAEFHGRPQETGRIAYDKFFLEKDLDYRPVTIESGMLFDVEEQKRGHPERLKTDIARIGPYIRIGENGWIPQTVVLEVCKSRIWPELDKPINEWKTRKYISYRTTIRVESIVELEAAENIFNLQIPESGQVFNFLAFDRFLAKAGLPSRIRKAAQRLIEKEQFPPEK